MVKDSKKFNSRLLKTFNFILDDMKTVIVMPSPLAPQGPIALYKNGALFVRLKPLNAIGKYEALSLVMHEGIPGHHLQKVYLSKKQNLPNFIKHPMFNR